MQNERSGGLNSISSELNEEIFREVFGPEYNGRVRGLGIGPTPSRYFGLRRFNINVEDSTSDANANEIAELK